MTSSCGPRRVVVVGGGPAGSVAARLLAARGAGVALVEAATFPRDKVCGECVSALGRRVLDYAGLGDVFASLKPVRLRRTTLFAGETVCAAELPEPMWGVTRARMDAALLDAAAAAGVDVKCPVRVMKVVPGSRPAVVCRPAGSASTYTLDADVVVLADGKSADAAATGDLGVKTHFAGVRADRHGIELHAASGGYVGIAPVAGGDGVVWNVAANVPADVLREAHGDFEAVLGAWRRVPSLATALAGATRVSPWLACPLPRYPVRAPAEANVYRVGVSAAALEPVGGEGMGLALASAAACASAVAGGNDAELDGVYRRLWRRRSWACRAAAVLLSARDGDGWLAAARLPGVTGLGLRLTGKAG